MPRLIPSPAHPLRVGIDAHAIGSRLGGNETYIRGVIEGLNEAPQHRYCIYVTDARNAATVKELCPAAETRVLGHSGALARLGYQLAWHARRDRVQVLHTQYVAPFFSPPIVVMIHDLSFRRHPEWFGAAERLRFELTVPWTARRAARVLTVSEFSRNDIIEHLRIDPAKVKVSYNRIHDRFRRATPDAMREAQDTFGIRAPYVLAVGNLQPRKNLPRLITAWQRLRERDPAFAPQLVIVGRKAWLFDETLREGASSRDAADILFTDYVPDELLPALYGGATVFVYPSMFEGFGLPPLEAMACGTPVVVSNTTSLPEVCGAAAEYVDPLQVESIAAGIEAVWRNPALRAQRSAAGLEQAEKFRTNALASVTVRAYEEAAALHVSST